MSTSLLTGRCPSADNPRTVVHETDCHQPGLLVRNDAGVLVSRTRGAFGNLCHVDCANQGICDYSTGKTFLKRSVQTFFFFSQMFFVGRTICMSFFCLSCPLYLYDQLLQLLVYSGVRLCYVLCFKTIILLKYRSLCIMHHLSLCITRSTYFHFFTVLHRHLHVFWGPVRDRLCAAGTGGGALSEWRRDLLSSTCTSWRPKLRDWRGHVCSVVRRVSIIDYLWV